MTEVPAVSIITPTYNHAAFLADCVASVLAQTFSSWEQIVIDDGSTDDSPAVMQRFASDPRVRYVRRAHRGIERLAETYNDALGLARAPLVAILEGDDTWPADKLATLVPAFADAGVVLAYGLTEVVGDGRALFGSFIPSRQFFRDFPSGVLTNTPVGRAVGAMVDCRGLTFTYPCSVVLRRAALDRIGGFQQRPGMPITDHPTFLRLALEGRFHFENRVMGYWRVHPGGTTVQKMDQILTEVHRDILDFRAAHADRIDVSAAAWRAIDRRWRVTNGGIAMRGARRLLLDGRWAEARRGLRQAIADARWQTRISALAALTGSCAGRSIEWAYRLTGRAWFRRIEPGKFEVFYRGKS